MAYNVNPGDEVEIVYENDAGERKETHGVVELNTTQMDPDEYMGSPKVRLKSGTGRTAHRIVLRNDGSISVSPYLNANGRGEEGYVKTMQYKEAAQ
jgi:uncharacterized protein YwbE